MNNDQHQQDQPKETTKQTMPGSPVQAGQQYETPEPKRRQPEPPAEAKRAPQHEPGYEAKQKAEADKEQGKQDKADDKDKPKHRTHLARRKTEVKRGKVRRHK